jgi:hypothetical protein
MYDLIPESSTLVIQLHKAGAMNARSRLLICNVPLNCQDADLKAWIEAGGYEVKELRIIRDLVSGTSPSFAHVELTNSEKLGEAAQALNGQVLLGTPLRVISLTARRSGVAGAVRS